MNITVLGTGSWGSALAQTLCDNGHKVCMYGVDAGEIRDINENHANSKYFPDVTLPKQLRAYSDPAEALGGHEAVVLTVPTSFMRDALGTVAEYFKSDTLIINAAKGIDMKENMRMSDVIRETTAGIVTRPIASIIGPSHAEEVILRKLTSVCAVSLDEETAKIVQRLFSNEYLRLYVNTDEVGAEYGVAIKNVIAIASGILTGLGYGDNAKAALVTRGLREMIGYGTVKGGRRETFAGLTGIGDLIVTCFSPHSRNFQAGLQIGRDDSAENFFATNTKTVEGIFSCRMIYEDYKSSSMPFEMPIVEELYKVLYQGKEPSVAVSDIMNRPLKPE